MKLWFKAIWNCTKAFLTNGLFLFFVFIVAAFEVIALMINFPKISIPIAFCLMIIVIIICIGLIVWMIIVSINDEHERIIDDSTPEHILMNLRQQQEKIRIAIHNKRKEINALENEYDIIDDKIDELKGLNDDKN